MTSQITEINRPVIQKLVKELEPLMKNIVSNYGLDASYKRGSYSDSFVNMTFEVVVPGIHEEEVNDMAKDLGAHFSIGDEYTDSKGETFRITGINTKARKNKVLLLRVRDGERYVTSIVGVNSRMRFEKAKARAEKAKARGWKE